MAAMQRYTPSAAPVAIGVSVGCPRSVSGPRAPAVGRRPRPPGRSTSVRSSPRSQARSTHARRALDRSLEDVDAPCPAPGRHPPRRSALRLRDGEIVRQSDPRNTMRRRSNASARAAALRVRVHAPRPRSAPLAPSGGASPGHVPLGVPPGRLANALRVRVGAEPIGLCRPLAGHAAPGFTRGRRLRRATPTASRPTGRRRRRRAGRHQHCAGPTCSRRRRARSTCSRRRTCRSSRDRRVEENCRSRRMRRAARRSAARARRRVALPRATASTRRAEFWARAISAWTPSRLPPVKMLPAPRSAYPV